jgi:hypothetical protein
MYNLRRHVRIPSYHHTVNLCHGSHILVHQLSIEIVQLEVGTVARSLFLISMATSASKETLRQNSEEIKVYSHMVNWAVYSAYVCKSDVKLNSLDSYFFYFHCLKWHRRARL